MRIAVDRNIPGVNETFAHHGVVDLVDGRTLDNRQLANTEVLITRSITRVGPGLLEGTPVRFVGTATIGTDHLDLAWLKQQGIAWASAPGCNADAAAQYTLAMAWLACERLGRNLAEQSVGIIGRGKVGSRVQKLMNAIGAMTIANDPPLADQGEKGLVSFEEALAQDLVCLHVPLSRGGPHPTFRMIDQEQLLRMGDSALLVNTARGDVVNGKPLLSQLNSGRLHAALDVWPGEPRIDPELVMATTVATPHVAGYSDDGKLNGTGMVYAAFCAWLDEPPVIPASDGSEVLELDLHTVKNPISAVLEAACFVLRHDREMRYLAGLTPDERATHFDALRYGYPSRRDFHAWRICGANTESAITLRKLGFRVD
jgi:erythronate-4-phosphate dehydrogenase